MVVSIARHQGNRPPDGIEPACRTADSFKSFVASPARLPAIAAAWTRPLFRKPVLRADMLRRNSFIPGAPAGNFVDAFSSQSIARRVSFQAGDLLRQKGVHYRDMFLTIDGDLKSTS